MHLLSSCTKITELTDALEDWQRSVLIRPTYDCTHAHCFTTRHFHIKSGISDNRNDFEIFANDLKISLIDLQMSMNH